MTIQARKLHVIEDLLRIQDEKAIKRIAEVVVAELKQLHQDSLKPMTIANFDSMVNDSIGEYKAGETVEHEDLKERIKDWK